VDNMHYLQTNSYVHDINKRHKNHLHILLVRLSAIHRIITYNAIKAFNKLSPSTSRLKNDRNFLSLFEGIILLHTFLSLQKRLYQIITSF
jgi:hypothetical protein